MIETARAYLDAGLCPLPAILAEKRPNLSGWKQYQQRRPTEHQLQQWFADPQPICLLAGAVSGNLEMLDFDCRRRSCSLRGWNWSMRRPRVVESAGHRTVAVGWSPCRLPLRSRDPRQPQAGAADGAVAERRGTRRSAANVIAPVASETATKSLTRSSKLAAKGDCFSVPPTPGYELEQGDFQNLPVLTDAERKILIEAGYALNEAIPPAEPPNRPSGTSGRPGDDFNERGDVRALLERHGWSCVRRAENECWRRPGKDRGWSATLRNRVFYVVSSNAAPFESDRAYSPFTVYALLEHNGDYEEAARMLRRDRFGGDMPASDDVDLSKLLVCDDNEQRPEASDDELKDPGPIPEEYFHIPGFVARVMDFTLAKAPYPNVGLAFCGAMALQSFLCGRKVCTPSDLRPNLYLLALAGSGTGKDFPRKVNARILLEIGEICGLGDKFASGEGIQDALLRSSTMLFQNDEMDGVFRQINLDRENRRESIPNILLTLYTSANDVYPLRVKAGQKETIHIDQPHVTLYGTATPEYFYESLSLRMLTNGFFARLIIVDVGRRGAGQLGGSVRQLPEEILAEARWWAEFEPGRRRGNLLSVHPEPRIVPFDSEATEAYAQLRRQTEAEYDAADESKDEVGRTAWSRTCEHAGKLALIYACSENHEEPAVSRAAIEWAAKFAMHQTRRQLYLVKSYMAANEFDGYCKQALRYLTRCRDSGKDYPVPDWLLRRRLALSPVMHNSVIEALTRQERIRWTTVPRKTKPRTGWALL